MRPQNIVILTGAGISAESGLATFRAEDGLWEEHRVEDVATPEGFARDPALVQAFYNARRLAAKAARPNPAHLALARLEAESEAEVLVVTQNVDHLHEDAGSRNVIHMHGQVNRSRCTACGKVLDWEDDLRLDTVCPTCGSVGTLRPHIVWFGEMPLELDRIYGALAGCDLFMAIGTSGAVYPAAGFIREVRAHGFAHTVEFNLEPSLGSHFFEETVLGRAGSTLPAYVETLLSGA